MLKIFTVSKEIQRSAFEKQNIAFEIPDKLEKYVDDYNLSDYYFLLPIYGRKRTVFVPNFLYRDFDRFRSLDVF